MAVEALTSEMQFMFDVGVIIAAAALLGLISKALDQPLVVGYIFAGILIGPEVLGIVENTVVIRGFQELGIALLLFIVGLEIDISKLKDVGGVILGTALAQVFMTFGVGFWIMFLLGFGAITSIYTGLIVAFSSTAVLIKMISDSDDIDTLHGRITLGILLIQDVLVVLSLSMLSTLSSLKAGLFISSILRGGGMLALAVVMSHYIIPSLFKLIEDSHELIFTISLAVLFGFIALSRNAGMSLAVGGFMAGLSLTAFPYNVEISERARSVRDFFVTIFFVSLGMGVNVSELSEYWVPFLLLLAVVIFLKPFMIDLMMSLLKHSKKTSFYTAISLGQVSEFSLVIALVGTMLGHIGEGILSLAAALLIVSVLSTSYSLKYKNKLYGLARDFLLDVEGREDIGEDDTDLSDHIVLCGADVRGSRIIEYLEREGEDVVVVDYDPDVVRDMGAQGFNVVYGDIADPEILDRANISEARFVVSTVPDDDASMYLLDYMDRKNPDAVVVVSARDTESALKMYEKGADYVLFHKMLAAREAKDLVAGWYEDWDSLEEDRMEDLDRLEHEVERTILEKFEPSFVKNLRKRIEKQRGGRE
ncbi:MAG: cation:proton antiporter [Candidatus Nanohaloarchaea archaeon]|nr:cation:proton antiporter [Candidatus Nanohaloarchaea archaeon]